VADEVLSLRDLLLYIRTHEERIFVRTQITEGVWQDAPLTDLPDELWAEHVARFIVLWLLEGAVPVRARTDAESADIIAVSPSLAMPDAEDGDTAALEGESFEAGA
jgi:hypothetical protein